MHDELATPWFDRALERLELRRGNRVLALEPRQADIAALRGCIGDDGELTNYRGILLQDISDILAKELMLPEVPSSMRVNITRTGCINMFLSLTKHVGFCTGIEYRFLPIFQHVVDIIKSVT